MSQQERPDELHKESPATLRRPTIVRAVSWVGNFTLGGVWFVVIALFLLPLFDRLLTPGVPATRSELLEKERRMAAIEKAEREMVGKEQVDGSR